MRKFKSITVGFCLAITALAMTASSALAAPITVPTGLNPGDTYRLAFVTSTRRDATSTDIADYNAFVTGVANTQSALAALGTTWTAIASTATVNAMDNTSTVPSGAGGSLGVPIFLLNDTQVADSYDDLWDGSTDVGLNINENGLNSFGFGAFVWTGTNGGGASSIPLGSTIDVNGQGPSASIGTTFRNDQGWIFQLGSFVPTSSTLSFYGISGLLTVPSDTVAISTSGSLSLLALGLVGLGFAQRKKKVA